MLKRREKNAAREIYMGLKTLTNSPTKIGSAHIEPKRRDDRIGEPLIRAQELLPIDAS